MSFAGRRPLRIVGRYAVYDEIAAGGMATVHIGRLLGPVGFARTVAIKRLHAHFARDPEFVTMFLDEARVAARVQHPNVVATIDVVATDAELFLIMDYVRGESLAKLARVSKREGRPTPPRVAAAIMCGFLHGLHAAHEAKDERGDPLALVHRDVSPQNVMVGADGVARVLDFGVAKAHGRIQVTREGQIKGKLAYMPPEQIGGGLLTRTVDVYASAVVMWELLTGERLFRGANEAETLAKILRDTVPPPSALVPSLPAGLDAVLLRALSREPSSRHPTAKELALDLERCCGVASATEVGAWVEALAGQTLLAREHEVAQMEISSTGLAASASGSEAGGEASERSVFPPPEALDAAADRQRAVLQAQPPSTAPVSGSSRRGRTVVLVTAASALMLFAAMITRRIGSSPAQPVPAGEVAAPSPPPSTLPREPAPIARSYPVVVTPPAESSSAARPPAPRPLVRSPKRPATPSLPPDDCDPPYAVDERGRKKYKLECM